MLKSPVKAWWSNSQSSSPSRPPEHCLQQKLLQHQEQKRLGNFAPRKPWWYHDIHNISHVSEIIYIYPYTLYIYIMYYYIYNMCINSIHYILTICILYYIYIYIPRSTVKTSKPHRHWASGQPSQRPQGCFECHPNEMVQYWIYSFLGSLLEVLTSWVGCLKITFFELSPPWNTILT